MTNQEVVSRSIRGVLGYWKINAGLALMWFVDAALYACIGEWKAAFFCLLLAWALGVITRVSYLVRE